MYDRLTRMASFTKWNISKTSYLPPIKCSHRQSVDGTMNIHTLSIYMVTHLDTRWNSICQSLVTMYQKTRERLEVQELSQRGL